MTMLILEGKIEDLVQAMIKIMWSDRARINGIHQQMLPSEYNPAADFRKFWRFAKPTIDGVGSLSF